MQHIEKIQVRAYSGKSSEKSLSPQVRIVNKVMMKKMQEKEEEDKKKNLMEDKMKQRQKVLQRRQLPAGPRWSAGFDQRTWRAALTSGHGERLL